MNTQLPECIPASLHCTPIEPCPTIWPHCPGQAAGNPGPVGPTGIQHCTAAPAFCGNTAWHGCQIAHTEYTGTLTCVPPAGAAQPGTIGPTGIQHCTAAPAYCGNTAWHGCQIGVTGWHTCSPATVCPPVTGPNVCITPPPTQFCVTQVCITPPPTPYQPCLGPTGWHTCVPPAGAVQPGAQTLATVCTQLGCPPHTHVHATSCPPATVCPQPTTLCPPPAGAAQAQTGPIGPTGIQHCTIAPAYCGNTAWHGCPQQTLATVCTQLGCPPHTHVYATSCPPATVCPQPTTLCPPAPQPGTIGPTGVQHCTIAPAYCGNTAWHGCPPQQQTLATVCTQLGCPPHTHVYATSCPPATVCPQSTTLCPPPVGAAQAQPGPIGPTGIQHCTIAPAYCGNTQWQGCTQQGCPIGPTGWHTCSPATICPPAEAGIQAGAQVGPTGIQHCTIAPPYCGNTQWAGCNPQAGPTPSAVSQCPGCGPISRPPFCPTVAPLCFPTVPPLC
jgi:hypothetical protein